MNSQPEARNWQGIVRIYRIPNKGQAGGVLTGNHVNLQDFAPEARLVRHWQGIMWIYRIPHQGPGWWGIDRESCEFTGFPTRGQAGEALTGNQVNLQDSPPRARLVGYWQGIMWIYRIPHQRPGWWGTDRESCEFTGFPTRAQAGGVLTGNHVNLQDSPPGARLVRHWQGIM